MWTYLQHRKFMIDNKCKYRTRDQQKFNSERIVIRVISRPELDIHQIQSGQRCRNEDQLHCRIIKAHECRDQIQVSRNVCNGKQNLGLSRDTLCWKRNVQKHSEKSFKRICNTGLPAQDRVFHIFSSRIIIASKCDKSPANRKIFILFWFCSLSYTI